MWHPCFQSAVYFQRILQEPISLLVKQVLYGVLLVAVPVMAGGCRGGDTGQGEPTQGPQTDSSAMTRPGRDTSLSPMQASIVPTIEDDVAALQELGVRLVRDHRGTVWSGVAVGLEITDADLARLRGLPQLESLEIADCPITDAGLANLAGLTELQILYLSDVPITDRGLAHLGDLDRLTVLSLQNTKITGKGLVHLKDLTDLEVLNLSDTAVTDDALEHLGSLAELDTLALEGTMVTDAGLVHCGPLDKLRVLNLNRCAVTDDGLENLLGLTNLRMLYAAETKLTAENAEKFRLRMTSLAVQR